MSVSIHTPARGVTFDGKGKGYAEFVSIHTPARGVTQDELVLIQDHGFQSTRPRGA